MENVRSSSPFQAEILLRNGRIHVIGPLSLVQRMQSLKNQHGLNPKSWPELEVLQTSEDLLINEFILKVKGQFKLAYEHEELCHCRMVPALRVYDSIKQGCQTVEQVGRSTLAGTGCGSCRPDIEKLLQQFRLKSSS